MTQNGIEQSRVGARKSRKKIKGRENSTFPVKIVRKNCDSQVVLIRQRTLIQYFEKTNSGEIIPLNLLI